MAVVSEMSYWVVCDWPECGASTTEGDGLVWNEPSLAVADAIDADWAIRDERHFCPEHHLETLRQESVDRMAPVSGGGVGYE